MRDLDQGRTARKLDMGFDPQRILTDVKAEARRAFATGAHLDSTNAFRRVTPPQRDHRPVIAGCCLAPKGKDVAGAAGDLRGIPPSPPKPARHPACKEQGGKAWPGRS